MTTTTKEPTLTGGPLDLSADVAVAFLAHIEALAAAGIDEKAFEAAHKRRTYVFKRMDASQRKNVLLICNAMTHLAQA